jgi:hypothetical protein
MRQRWRMGLGICFVIFAFQATPAVAASAWQIVPSPTPPGSNYGQLTGTVMTGASSAWAVGYARVGNNPFRALIDRWNGTSWTNAGSASVPASHTTFLNAAAATSASDVWAVGSDAAGAGNPPNDLIEHWNGVSWLRSPTATGEPAGSTLLAVSADSPSDAWAVGYTNNPITFGFRPLIEHFNGTSWRAVPGASAYPVSGSDRLLAVAAVSPTDVWALGVTGRHPDPVFEHFNGSRWSLVPQPASGYDTFLGGITVISSSDIWAVGGTQVTNTLAEHWNGRTWSIVPTPNVTGSGSVLNDLGGVSALGPANIWAVGTTTNNSFNQTLTEHWNGMTWSIVASPNAGFSGLSSVSGLSAGSVFGVGIGATSTGVPTTLIIKH